MKYIQYNNATKHELIKELVELTGSGQHIENVLDYLSKKPEILQDDEFVKVSKDTLNIRSGKIYNYMPNDKYSINIRKSLFILIMLILDSNLTKGVASTLLAMTGIASQTVHKILDKERCVLLDTLVSDKRTTEDFLYFEKECVQNDIDCPYRNNYYCNRDLGEIDKLVGELMNKEIIISKNGIIKIAL